MKRKRYFWKIVFIGLATLLSIPGTRWSLEAAASDEANEPQKQPERQNEWRNFQNRYNGNTWKIEWDKKSLTPKKITGGGIKASQFGIARVTEDNIDALAKSFIGANKSLLKIIISDLEIVKRHVDRAQSVISYRQLYSKIPVYNSVVTLAVKNDKIVAFRANHHTGISISTTPSITKEEAVTIARRFFKVEDKGGKSGDPSLVIYPLTKGGEYALTYQVALPMMENPSKERDKPVIAPTVFVDAHTGAIRDVIDNIVYDDLSGTVTGKIYPLFAYPDYYDENGNLHTFWENKTFINNTICVNGDRVDNDNPSEPPVLCSNGYQDDTDLNGLYSISGLTAGDVTVSAYLAGPYVNVYNMNNQEDLINRTYSTHSATISVPGTHDWNWVDYDGYNNDGSYKNEESNAFYHANVIHDYIKYLGVTEMDFQMPVNVNWPYPCNAFWLRDCIRYTPCYESINFFMADDSCESAALDASAIYHEYGHGINYHLLSPVYWPYWKQTGNMNEGIADYWAATILGDPCGYRFVDQNCLRRTDTSDRYPDNYNIEAHSGAQIISGALWDIREELGANVVDSLVVRALREQPMTFSDFLENILRYDDNNEELDDGTPNIDIICHSFWDHHGIFNEHCKGHTEQPVTDITFPAPAELNTFTDVVISIQGTAYGTISNPLASYTLEYEDRFNPGNWSTEGITITGGPVVNGVLGQWDINSLSTGFYKLRVTVTMSDSTQYHSYPVTVTIREVGSSGVPVTITGNSTKGKAKGTLGTVYNSADNVQYIGCKVDSSPGISVVRCEAKDAAGATASCFSTDAGMVETVSKINGDSSIYFWWDTDGNGVRTCGLVVTNTSELPFKAP